MLQTQYKICFTNNFHKTKEKLNDILEYLKNELPNLTEDDLFDLRIIYNELIANAIIHGNKQDSAKKVELFIEISDCTITSVVKDEGNGFDYSYLFHSIDSSDNLFLEHGRGLKLVYSLADFIGLNEIGNEIMFQKKIHKLG